ncbi:MAG: hypothetical protein OEY56_06125 [Cyclobacteriaceae bacterium]|nr:hypothetical protein [Cyclobacteriaceae bacterium]
MRQVVTGFLLLLLAGACIQPSEQGAFTRQYISLDSLIREQSKKMEGVRVYKTVEIDGETENKTLLFDSANWARELGVLTDLDLNKPKYQGTMYQQIEGNQVSYYPLPDRKSPLVFVSYTYDNQGFLNEIEGEFTDDEAQAIYTTWRKYQLTFDGGVISSYLFRGYQKIVMKDTVWFRIEGNVLPASGQ